MKNSLLSLFLFFLFYSPSYSQCTLSVSVASSTNVSCNGGSNGSITITASGGTTPYQYSIDTGKTYQASNVLTGLVAGSYAITVLDAGGCSATASQAITQPSALSVSTTTSDETCPGRSDGLITVTASGGAGSYTYSSDSGKTYQASNLFVNLTSGTYAVTAKDINGCTGSIETVTITASTQISINVSASPTTVCKGSSSALTANASGGTAPYSYIWPTGDVTSSISVTPNTTTYYPVYAIDDNGCTSSYDSVMVTVDSVPAVTISLSKAKVCQGEKIALAANSTGNSPFTYSWSTGATTLSDTVYPSATTAYKVTVTDVNNCSATATSDTITVIPSPSVNITFSDSILCPGKSIVETANASGGASPYTYSWSTGETTASVTVTTNLAPGSVYVTDVNGCSSPSLSFPITSYSGPGVSLSSFNISCTGDSNGSVTVTATGGFSPYQYSINNGAYQASDVFNNLAPGNYTIIVQDAKGCTTTVSQTITQPAALTASITGSSPAICQGSTDTLTANPSGGSSPYTYNWSTGAATAFITVSPTNTTTYTVTVTDANGCTSDTASATVTVDFPPPLPSLVIVATSPNIQCYGGSDTLMANITSGLTYQWYNGGTDIAGATNSYYITYSPGTFTLVATTNSKCPITSTDSKTITEVTALAASIANSNDTLYTITTGGTGPYNYTWKTNGNTICNTDTCVAPANGSYLVTIRDANGCTDTISYLVSGITPVQTAATFNTITIYPNPVHDVVYIVPGNQTANIVYSLNDMAGKEVKTGTGNIADVSELEKGAYIVKVQTENGVIYSKLVVE